MIPTNRKGRTMLGIAMMIFKALVGPVFNFLNKRLDVQQQMHLVDGQTLQTITTAGISAASKADEVMGAVRIKEGTWGPTVLMMLAVLTPLIWHEWQVVGASSHFIPAIGYAGLFWDYVLIPYPTVETHVIGSWHVA